MPSKSKQTCVTCHAMGHSEASSSGSLVVHRKKNPWVIPVTDRKGDQSHQTVDAHSQKKWFSPEVGFKNPQSVFALRPATHDLELPRKARLRISRSQTRQYLRSAGVKKKSEAHWCLRSLEDTACPCPSSMSLGTLEASDFPATLPPTYAWTENKDKPGLRLLTWVVWDLWMRVLDWSTDNEASITRNNTNAKHPKNQEQHRLLRGKVSGQKPGSPTHSGQNPRDLGPQCHGTKWWQENDGTRVKNCR